MYKIEKKTALQHKTRIAEENEILLSVKKYEKGVLYGISGLKTTVSTS